ncbi:MAG: hypothetical protein J7J06_03455, partial [Methanosarcinales archaeon]|nr:hypothetical protein [Methanosarcinales archaeon]
LHAREIRAAIIIHNPTPARRKPAAPPCLPPGTAAGANVTKNILSTPDDTLQLIPFHQRDPPLQNVLYLSNEHLELRYRIFRIVWDG